MSWEVITISTS